MIPGKVVWLTLWIINLLLRPIENLLVSVARNRRHYLQVPYFDMTRMRPRMSTMVMARNLAGGLRYFARPISMLGPQ